MNKYELKEGDRVRIKPFREIDPSDILAYGGKYGTIIEDPDVVHRRLIKTDDGLLVGLDREQLEYIPRTFEEICKELEQNLDGAYAFVDSSSGYATFSIESIEEFTIWFNGKMAISACVDAAQIAAIAAACQEIARNHEAKHKKETQE